MEKAMHSPAGIVLLCVFTKSVFAGLILGVNPVTPTAATPITVGVWELFADPGQVLTDASLVRSGNQISIEVIMQDLHGGGGSWIQVVTPGGATLDLGILAEGSYEVDATMRMILSSGGPAVFYDSGTSSFQVVPEPSSLGVLAAGSLALAHRRRRTLP